jgi:ABC-type branched-subunit amino acid transport system substrate-binding protein
VLGLLTIAGCGGDDDAGPETTGAPTTGAPDATEAPSTEAPDTTGAPSTEAPDTTATAATGDPVTVWVIEDSSEAAGVTFPSLRAGIEARVTRINAEGGLGSSGRPVEVKYCVTNFDPNAAAQCARDAVADDTAIAVAGGITANGDTILPILEAGGLASVGATAFSQTDGTSSVSFPTMGGLVAATGCQATLLRDVVGAKAIGVARGDTPGADQVGALLTALGVPPAAEVVTPIANPDYSAEMGAISAQVDALLLAQDGATALKTVTSLRAIGSDIAVAGSGAQSWTPERIGQAGDAVEGMYLALWYAADDMPGAAEYLADMEAIDALDQSDDQAKLGWVAYELLNQVATGLETIDRTTILDALSNLTDFDGGGLTPTIDFTTPGELVFGTQPRLVNESCVYAQIRDGRIVSIDGEFVTPLTDS